MAKGKFSKSRDSGHSWKMEETAELPQLPPEEIGPEEDRPAPTPGCQRDDGPTMPELNFGKHTDETITDAMLEDLSWLNFPELDGLELNSAPREEGAFSQDSPEDQAPSAPPTTESSDTAEEEEIEAAFRQAAPEPAPSKATSWFSARKKALILTLSSILGVILLCLLLAVTLPNFLDPYDHLILSNVSVAGMDLGGMTRKQAIEAVEAKLSSLWLENDMVITLPEGTITLKAEDSGISLNTKAAVKAAYRYGRTGSRQEKEQAFQASFTEPHPVDLIPHLSVNKSYIQGQIQTYALEHKTEFMPSSYALEGQMPPLEVKKFNSKNSCQTLLLNLGTPELMYDADKITQQLLNAYAELKFAVSVTPDQVGKTPDPLDLQKILDEVSIEPVDSILDMETFDIISGSYGYTFDKLKASRELVKAEYGDTIRIPMEYKRPDKLDEDLLFQDVLGETETPHGDNEKRNANLKLACETINGMILYPGDEFSFNETLGERTAEKGYQAAPAYSGTRLVNSLGGGICQVSSTLYYACLLADMEITDRINHGFLSSYIAPGMDATVSWEKPDYKFKNSSNFPIKILAEATEDKVKFKIMGTDDKDYYVEMEYTDSVTSADVIYQSYSPDQGYKDGEVIQSASDGHHVVTYRCKYDKQTKELISREMEARSSYPVRNGIIASVKAPETPPEEAAPETP